MSVPGIAGFGRMLREAGLPVGTGALLDLARAAALVPGEDLYWVGRATLVSRPDDIPVYDRVFRACFGGVRAERERARTRLQVAGAPGGDDHAGDARALPGEAPDAALASDLEALRRRSFARMTPRELEEAAALMARLRLVAPTRRSRRRAAARRGEPDLRRTLRRALRTGGEPIERPRRARRERPRRLVLLLDISGSMAAHSRALLRFAHAAVGADQRWEAFCFGTRLTRLTGVLRGADPGVALARAAEAALDWDGGTRIGQAVRALIADRRGGTVRGAVVVICSDGLDVGDPTLLGEEMARLARLAHRTIWVNPLRENPDYAPLARGMAAALPHVDRFASGHNLEELAALADLIAHL